MTDQMMTMIMAAAAALLYLGFYLPRPPAMLRTALKTISILLLASLAWQNGAPVLLVAALLVCAVGDACLAYDGDKPFLAGLTAFLIGHILYIALFWKALAGHDVNLGILAMSVLVLGMFAAHTIKDLWPHLGSLRLPVIVYILVITAMVIMAIILPTVLWPAIIGALLFATSDRLLAHETFTLKDAEKPVWLPRAIWTTYWLGQALITVGFVF